MAAENQKKAKSGGLILLRQGFRPLFLLAGIYAVLVQAIWQLTLAGYLNPPTAFGPLAWHSHEMLFGFIAAALGGFLLTAIPNWTGRLPVSNGPLAVLALFWIAGRAAVFMSAALGPWVTGVLDCLYLFYLTFIIVREILAGENWRNIRIALPVGLLAACNAVIHADAVGLLADAAGQATKFGIFVMLILISLIGGRVVPSFTRNWLVAQGETRVPAPFGRLDGVAIAALVLLALAILVLPPESRTVGWLALAAGVLHGVRLSRWRGHRTMGEPLVFILHVGYFWLPAGLLLYALSQLAEWLSTSAALHALTAGAMGTMILAIMTRAILGHSGRPLHADRATVAAYLLVTVAAVIRIAAPSFAEPALAYGISGLAWICAYGIFVAAYGPILIARGAD